jgi:anti-sigma-K factor RskA
MSTNGHYEDEDLAFYALGQLPEGEIESIERKLAESEAARERLAAVRASLMAYGQSTVTSAVPEGSLDRFLGRLSEETKRPAASARSNAAPLPFAVKVKKFAAKNVTRPEDAKGAGKVLPWLGWVAAAVLAITLGALYEKVRTLEAMPRTEMAATVTQPSPGVRPPDTVPQALPQSDGSKAVLDRQTKQIEQLTTEAAKAKKESETLRSILAGQSAVLSQQNAAVADARVEEDRLKVTLAAQAGQVAQLSSAAGVSHHVMDALTDISALRVTLTRPKAKPAPTGRATYVQNRGTLVFLASNLAPLKDDKVYQLWLMPLDGSAPVPAGTFSPDPKGNASVVYDNFPQAVAAKGFAVTVENEGGSQTPTLPILLAGSSGA